jgi:hypothetical protein
MTFRVEFRRAASAELERAVTWQPSGPSSKLLDLIERKGLEAVL